MTDKEHYIEQITSLLNRYKRDLIDNGKFNFLNSHVHAEYFLKQLLNHACPKWRLKHTSEYYSHNTSSIDLFDKQNGLVVQVTAQNSNHRNKIKGTIEKFNRDWKAEFPHLRIFFISDVEQELVKEFKTDKIKIISFKTLIPKIESEFTPEQAYNLLEFLKEQFSTSYTNTPYTFDAVASFQDSKLSEGIGVTANTLQYKSNLLYFTQNDKDRIQILRDALLKNQNAKVFLEGPPCVGKTTLTFELENQISKELIKTFYIDITGYGNNDSGIKRDIDKVSVHDALLIIDNSQENLELAENIYAWLRIRSVRALFISRFISNQSSASFSNFPFDERISLNSDLEDDTILKKKIDGIIQNRIKHLKEKHPQYKWDLKNINTVYLNCEFNFLKLSIILYFWEKDYQDISLELIDNGKIYTSFYDHHKLKSHDDKTVFKYASLFKYDYPFFLTNIDDTGTSQLIDKGIIQKRKFYDQYFFPHVEYANLLAKAIAYKKEYTSDRETIAITEYISEKKPKNIHVLLNNIGTKHRTEIFNQIFSSSVCSDFFCKHYNGSSLRVSEIKNLFSLLYDFRAELNKQSVKSFLEKFVSFQPHTVFKLYERDGNDAFQNLSKCLSLYQADTSILSEFYTHNKSGAIKRAEGKSFFEISELLTKNTREPKFVANLVNSFSFLEWKEMFSKQPGFSLKAEGINNLSKNALSRQLAVDLYSELELQYSFNQLKSAEIDVIGKALSDLSEFEAIDYKGKPRQILKLLFDNGSLRDGAKSGLSKFAIGIAHLSKVNSEIVEQLFPTPVEIGTLLKNATANDFAQRIPLFVKHFPLGNNLFIDEMRKSITSKSFLESNKSDLNGLIN